MNISSKGIYLHIPGKNPNMSNSKSNNKCKQINESERSEAK
jgi:hypothetical protein